jgi:general secretion pathway protein D
MILSVCTVAPIGLWVRVTRLLSVLLIAASAVLAAGCAEQRIRDQSQQFIAAGNYQQAVRALEDGLAQYPKSVVLRSGLIQARTEALARLVAQASTLRSAGKMDEAQHALEQAQALEPENTRLAALLAELSTERRQQAALSDAEGWVAKKRPDAALRMIEQSLKDNPRHAGLLALQRRLEVEQRQAQVRASQAVLAESRAISLDFRDANLRTVLDVVSRNSGINFILDRDIRADTRVTVLLRQARVEDALDLIVSTNQLAKKVVDAQTIIVYPNTAEKQREYQEQIVRVFYLASAEAKGAAAFLKAMLKIREPFVDERSNMLSLRESQENIQLAERLIALYDAGEPEVLLEVEVLEINSTRLTALGVRFPDSFSLTVLPPGGATGLNLENTRNITRDRVALGIGGVLVNLRREVGDFTTLANPRIRARNKEKAKILIGDKIPVITATTGQAGFVSDSVNYLDVGLKLDVEPTIYADDEVAIKIALEVSSLGTSVKTASGTLAYQIGTRNASTVLRLHDNETQLLAGLISKDDRTSASRVPGIGDLPVLGRLFSDQTDNSQRTELVLAITPRILRNIRRPDANESELWVGTEALPKLRPVGGLRANASQDPSGAATMAPSTTDAATAQGGDMKSASGPATQLKWMPVADAKVGDTVELRLSLGSSVPLRGMPVELAFAKDKLQLIDVEEGDFFRQGGAATGFSKSGDGKDGQLRAGVLRNQANGATGEGTVLLLRFKALAAGQAEVRVHSAQSIGIGAPAAAPTLPPALTLQIR